MNKNTFFRSCTLNSRQISISGSVTSMLDQLICRFHNKMTTDSDSECSCVANLADFNVIRVIVIVIKISVIIVQRVIQVIIVEIVIIIYIKMY